MASIKVIGAIRTPGQAARKTTRFKKMTVTLHDLYGKRAQLMEVRRATEETEL